MVALNARVVPAGAAGRGGRCAGRGADGRHGHRSRPRKPSSTAAIPKLQAAADAAPVEPGGADGAVPPGRRARRGRPPRRRDRRVRGRGAPRRARPASTGAWRGWARPTRRCARGQFDAAIAGVEGAGGAAGRRSAGRCAADGDGPRLSRQGRRRRAKKTLTADRRPAPELALRAAGARRARRAQRLVAARPLHVAETHEVSGRRPRAVRPATRLRHHHVRLVPHRDVDRVARPPAAAPRCTTRRRSSSEVAAAAASSSRSTSGLL